MEEYFEINGIKIRHSKTYLGKGNREVIHTTIRDDLYKELAKLSKKTNKPMSKCLDSIMITFSNHPEIYKEFANFLKKY